MKEDYKESKSSTIVLNKVEIEEHSKKEVFTKERKKKIIKLSLTIILFLFGIVMMLPVAWMISSSFKPENEILKVPIEWIPRKATLYNYKFALAKYPYLKWYFNTAKVTFFVVLFNITFSSLSGYAFAKLKFRGKDFIFFCFIMTLMIPHQIRTIPQFMMFRSLGMIDTHASLITPWMFNGFAIFLMRQFFMSIPDELIEAATIDGCSPYRIFFQIVLPLSKPAIMALVILSFTWGWNSYMAPLVYINDINKQMLAVGIGMFKAEYSQNYGPQMAGATLALIPILVVYMFAQKSFIEGIAMSGTKG